MKNAILILGLAIGLLYSSSGFCQSKRVQVNLVPLTAAGVVNYPDTIKTNDTAYLYLGASNSTTALANGDGSTTQFGDVVYEWSTVGLTGTSTGYVGTVIAQGSMTGTFVEGSGGLGDWVTLISDVTQYNGSSSIALVGSTNQFGYFILPKNQFKYVRLRVTGIGTGTVIPSGKAWILNHG